MTENHYHFYASSVAMWATTNDKRDLRQLLKLMDKDGYDYNLFLVPCKHTDEYEISMYQPMVKDTQWLGFYDVKKRSKEMTDTDYDLDTVEGMNNAVAWTRNMFSLINDGGTWMVPRSMTMVRISHTDKTATLIAGFAPDPSLRRVIEAMGWTVLVK